MPAISDTVVARSTTDTLSNKTIDTTAVLGNILKLNSQTVTSATGNSTKLMSATGTFSSGDCLKVDAAGNASDTGFSCSASGAPGGSTGQVQYNNAGAFGGDANFQYGGGGVATITIGQVGGQTTTNSRGLSIYGTWTTARIAYDAPLFMNIVNNQSGTGSLLADIQVSTSTLLGINTAGFVFGSGKDTGLARATTAVLAFTNGTNTSPLGFLNWGGEARVSSDVTLATSTTSLSNITGLSVSLSAGRTYSVEGDIYWQDAAAAGLQLALSGTLGATDAHYAGYIVDSGIGGIKGNVLATSMGTAVAGSVTTGTSGFAKLSGTISVNTAGTLTLQAAQFATSSVASTVTRGSRLLVHDIP